MIIVPGRVVLLLGIVLTLATGRAEAYSFLTLATGIHQAQGVAVDARRDVFFTDARNATIEEIVAVDGILPPEPTIRTVVAAGFAIPAALAVDGSGNLFVTDLLQQQVFEVTASSGYTSISVLGGGFGFNNPSGLAVDSRGNLFVADGSPIVYELTEASGYHTVIPFSGPWAAPVAVATDAGGDVFVADQGNGASGAVWEMLAAGGVLPASPTINQLATGFSFGPLMGIAVDFAGNAFVADAGAPAIDEIPAAGGYAGALTLPSGVITPGNLAVDNLGNVYIADLGNFDPFADFGTGTIEEIQFEKPVLVPTLGQWGLILFGLLLAAAACRKVRRAA